MVKNIIRRRILVIALSLICLTPLAAQYCQTGKASFYATKFNGRPTAGHRYIFHNDSMFCAHRTLPLGTFVEVTNLKNNHTVIVKVVDRGPYVRGRIVDLSQEAAKRLGFFSNGIAKVHIEVTDRVIQPFKIEDCELHAEPQLDTIALFNNLTPHWQEVFDLYRKREPQYFFPRNP